MKVKNIGVIGLACLPLIHAQVYECDSKELTDEPIIIERLEPLKDCGPYLSGQERRRNRRKKNRK